MLATLTDAPFNDPDWIFEDKFDGLRMVAVIKDGSVTLYSRNGKIISHSYVEVAHLKSRNYEASATTSSRRSWKTSIWRFRSARMTTCLTRSAGCSTSFRTACPGRAANTIERRWQTAEAT